MKMLEYIRALNLCSLHATAIKNTMLVKVLLIFAASSGFCQLPNDSLYNSLSENKRNSIFENIDSGNFVGQATGYIKLARGKDTIVLDFKGTNTALLIMYDSTEMYDKSTKKYTTRTTSGKTSFSYETYAMSNELIISLDGVTYNVSSIDGACDVPISGLIFNYCPDKTVEFLTLSTNKPIELTTTRELMLSKKLTYPQAYKSSRKITILPGSTIIFVVNK